MRAPDHTRRVVVTGLGVISPVGNDKASAWANLTNGVSGIREITKFDASAYEQRAAGEVDGFVPSQWMDAKAVRRSETSMHYGVAAATPKCMLDSLRRTAFGSIHSVALKSRTSPASLAS